MSEATTIDRPATQTEPNPATQADAVTAAEDLSAEDAILGTLETSADQGSEGTEAEGQEQKPEVDDIEEKARQAEIDAAAEAKLETLRKAEKAEAAQKAKEDTWKNEQEGATRVFNRIAPNLRAHLEDAKRGEVDLDVNGVLAQLEQLKGVAHNASLARIYDGFTEAFEPDLPEAIAKELKERSWRYPRPGTKDGDEFLQKLKDGLTEKAREGYVTEVQAEAKAARKLREFVRDLRKDPAKRAAFNSQLSQPSPEQGGARPASGELTADFARTAPIDQIRQIRARQLAGQ